MNFINFQLFNDISSLRKDNDEKIKAISDKSTQIFTLQSKLTNLTTKYEALKLQMENNSSPSQTSRSPPPKHRPSQTGLINPQEINPPQTKRKSKENLGFIDKHIIRPIRGGFFKFIFHIFNKFHTLFI